MKSPLYRLHRIKFAVLAVVLTATGVLILVLEDTAGSVGDFLRASHGADVGVGLLTAGLIGVLAEFRSRQDAEEFRDEGLRKILKEEAPSITDAVIDGFAVKPADLARVASPETLDQIAKNSLALRLGDEQLAAEVYEDIRAQVIGARNRCYNAKATVTLSPWEQGPKSGPDAMLVATVRWEYEVEPLTPVMRFSCVSSEADYRALLRDPTSTTTWLFRNAELVDAASREAFELVHFTLDGKEQRIRRSTRMGAQTYTVATGAAAAPPGKRSTMAYTFRTLARRKGGVFHLDIARPTKGLQVDVYYSGSGIEQMRIADYIASSSRPTIGHTQFAVAVRFGAWVWPKGGITIFWG
jgi:hypothetical protein